MPSEDLLVPAADTPGSEPALEGGASTDPQSAPSKGRSPLVGLVWWVIAGVIALDQLTKALIVWTIPVYASRVVIPGLVDLVHVHNAGVAFGLLNDSTRPQQSLMTTALALVALGGIAYYARHIQSHERVARLGLSLILGGAVGNLTDRIRQGFVVDFVDVYWRGWHFWAFNVADAAITIGAALIFLELLLPNRHASHPV
jgi:signal peptidase II